MRKTRRWRGGGGENFKNQEHKEDKKVEWGGGGENFKNPEEEEDKKMEKKGGGGVEKTKKKPGA